MCAPPPPLLSSPPSRLDCSPPNLPFFLSFHLFSPCLPSSVALSLRSLDCLSKKHNSLFSRAGSLQSDHNVERMNQQFSLSLVQPSHERYKYFCGFLSSGALRGIGRRINIPSMVATLSSNLTLSPFFSSRREMQAEAGREGELRCLRRRSD